MPSQPEPGSTSPSQRNLQILEVIAQEARPLTATEINVSLKLPKPTIHRLVANLESEGYLMRHLDGRSYLPGQKLRAMMLGVMRAGHHQLPQRDILIRLNDQVGETCNLSIPDGDAMVYVDRVETQWPLRIQLQIGSRVPLHATAGGKVSLAQMDETSLERLLKHIQLKAYTENTLTSTQQLRAELVQIRKQGYATDSEEFVPGMIAVAVPVIARNGTMIATISFHAPAQRLSLSAGLLHLPALTAAAADLAALA